MGARGGMIAPTLQPNYIQGRITPKGDAWDRAMEYWSTHLLMQGHISTKNSFLTVRKLNL